MIQPRDCCSPTANPYESGIRAPSRGRHPLPGQVIAGNAHERHPGHRIRQSAWWERNHGPRPRAPSQGTHPTAVAATSAEKERPRASCQAAPAGANTAGRLSRAVGVVPPNQRMQPDAALRPEIGAIVRAIMR
jgi:predicted component of type VI protein secretion system